MKKMLVALIIASMAITFFPLSVFADQADVVTLGADLTQEQQEQIFDWFDVRKEDVLVLEVTNEEERQYLEGIAPEEYIGTRAISSAYVKLLPRDAGIKVKTNNITWVTEQIYANALITAEWKMPPLI